MLSNGKAGIDTAWRSTPVKERKEIFGELLDGFMYTPYGQSVGEGDIVADMYGLQHSAYIGEEANLEDIDQYWPETTFRPQWEHGRDGKEKEMGVGKEDHFRAGIMILERGDTTNPSMEQSAVGRYVGNRCEYGPFPYAKWESLTDTARSPYETETAGNIRFPKTNKEWGEMVELGGKLHLLYLGWARGGVGNENIKRIYRSTSETEGGNNPEKEGWEFATAAEATLKPPTVRTPPIRSPESSASTTERADFRDRAKGEDEEEQRPSASSIYVPAQLGAQQSLNAIVGKSIVDENIHLPLSSLAPSTQSEYLRCWGNWARYCEARQISPWADANAERMGSIDPELSNMWYSVMEIGGSGLVAIFSAIKSPHAIEGRRYFDHKTYRSRLSKQ